MSEPTWTVKMRPYGGYTIYDAEGTRIGDYGDSEIAARHHAIAVAKINGIDLSWTKIEWPDDEEVDL